jgi:hypothetical protein
VARKKGDKDYSQREKQMMISLINDYSLFGATDSEIIQMLSIKIGKKISETLFYRLKKEAVKLRGESEQWLHSFAKYQFIEFYRKRMEELELVQRTLLKVLIEETEKNEKLDKSIINQLSKTIADNSKMLGDFGMCPPVLSRIKSVLSENYFNSERIKGDQEVKALITNAQNIESGFYLKMDNEDDPKSKTLDYEDAQRVF